jgi:hypothetical protein
MLLICLMVGNVDRRRPRSVHAGDPGTVRAQDDMGGDSARLCAGKGPYGLPSLCLVIANKGSDKRRFFAVLHQPRVTSPVEGVRAAIVQELRSKA